MHHIENILRNSILQHLTFWTFSLFLLLRHFQASSTLAPTDFVYTAIFSVFLVLAVYLNLRVLIPTLFNPGRYGLFAVSLCLLLIAMSHLQMVLFDHIVEQLFPGYYLISYFDFWQTMQYFIVFLSISSLLHFSKSWFMYKETAARLVEIRKEKVEAELDALKSQINPHFLFNSLNSIYAMVLKQAPQAPTAMIRLSDAMRYIIYESNHDKVALQKELEFMDNYVELQRLRMSAKDKLGYRVAGAIRQQLIAPLLLIPIVENCFKYGIKGETEASFVDIAIEIGEAFIVMNTSNNIGLVDDVEKTRPKERVFKT